MFLSNFIELCTGIIAIIVYKSKKTKISPDLSMDREINYGTLMYFTYSKKLMSYI